MDLAHRIPPPTLRAAARRAIIIAAIFITSFSSIFFLSADDLKGLSDMCMGRGYAIASAKTSEDMFQWAFNWKDMCDIEIKPVW